MDPEEEVFGSSIDQELLEEAVYDGLFGEEEDWCSHYSCGESSPEYSEL